MVASLKFQNDAGAATAALDQVKIIILEDGTGNKYTLDTTTNNLKVAYTPIGGNPQEYTVDGLASALGKLLTIDGNAGKSVLAEEVVKKPVIEAIFDLEDNGTKISETKIGTTFAKKADLDNKADANGANLDDAKVTAILDKLTDKVVKTTELPAKVAEKAVVDAITTSADFTNKVYIKAAPADEVYTKTAADGGFVKINASNLTDPANQKAFAEAILPAKDGQKSILINKLGEALDRVADNKATDKVYGVQGSEKIAKDFLADKYPFAKIDASNLTDPANQKAFAEAILPAKDGQKSILVEKLGGFLDATETPYGAQGNQAAKAFLAEKGLKPVSSEVATELIANAQSKKGLADEIAKSLDLQEDLAESLELQNGLKKKLIADQKFKTEIKTQANAQDAGFQKAVKAVMSQDDSKKTILSSNDPVFKGAVQGVISQSESKSTIFSSSDPIFKGAVQDVISQEQSNFAIPQDSSSPLSWDWA